MSKVTVYGIPNCDTVKKSLTWLKNNKIDVEFIDYKKNVIPQQKLKAWCKTLGWENVLNKKSATWRGLSEAEQQSATNQTNAIAIMNKNMSIVKRPIIEKVDAMMIGFNEQEYVTFFNNK